MIFTGNRWLERALLLSALSTLGACDWVDSTGRQSDDSPAQGTEIFIDDTPMGGATEVLENSVVRVVVAREGVDDPSFDFRFEPDALSGGALDTCLVFDRFDADDAAASLEAACATDADCRIEVRRDEGDATGDLAFELVIPGLRAPVGVRYRLVTGRNVENEIGDTEFIATDERDVDLCLLSINDPPVARDDSYAVLAGGTLVVDAASGVLANDTDDDDVGNEPLQVSSEQVQAPEGAARFEIVADGSFLFQPDDASSSVDRSVAFDYTITDGRERDAESQEISSATVTLRVIAANQAPELIGILPVVNGRVGESLQFAFGDYFLDLEGAPLRYSFDTPLPAGGSLVLSTTGVLSGVPGASDAGEFALTLNVDDGGVGAQANVTLVIAAALVDLPPVFVAGSVSDRLVRLGESITPVRPQFSDPEGGALSFRSVGTPLPVGLALDLTDGSVSGQPGQRGLTSALVIEASDAGGQSVRSGAFSVRVF